MKKTTESLEKIRDKIGEKIEERESSFESKSENWQESDNGSQHEERTAKLQDAYDSLDLVIDEINEFIDW